MINKYSKVVEAKSSTGAWTLRDIIVGFATDDTGSLYIKVNRDSYELPQESRDVLVQFILDNYETVNTPRVKFKTPDDEA